MLKNAVVCLPVLACIFAAGTAFAQNTAPAARKFYKLDFVYREVEAGKVVNSRSYSAVAMAGERASIRAGSRVPVSSGGSSTQFSYFDFGVNIDCTVNEAGGDQLSVWISADISTTANDSAASPSAPVLPPTVRQNKWTSTVVVPAKKPTLVLSSDDLTSKRQMQLEVTATPVQ